MINKIVHPNQSGLLLPLKCQITITKPEKNILFSFYGSFKTFDALTTVHNFLLSLLYFQLSILSTFIEIFDFSNSIGQPIGFFIHFYLS